MILDIIESSEYDEKEHRRRSIYYVVKKTWFGDIPVKDRIEDSSFNEYHDVKFLGFLNFCLILISFLSSYVLLGLIFTIGCRLFITKYDKTSYYSLKEAEKLRDRLIMSDTKINKKIISRTTVNKENILIEKYDR